MKVSKPSKSFTQILPSCMHKVYKSYPVTVYRVGWKISRNWPIYRSSRLPRVDPPHNQINTVTWHESEMPAQYFEQNENCRGKIYLWAFVLILELLNKSFNSKKNLVEKILAPKMNFNTFSIRIIAVLFCSFLLVWFALLLILFLLKQFTTCPGYYLHSYFLFCIYYLLLLFAILYTTVQSSSLW